MKHDDHSMIILWNMVAMVRSWHDDDHGMAMIIVWSYYDHSMVSMFDQPGYCPQLFVTSVSVSGHLLTIHLMVWDNLPTTATTWNYILREVSNIYKNLSSFVSIYKLHFNSNSVFLKLFSRPIAQSANWPNIRLSIVTKFVFIFRPTSLFGGRKS